MARERVYRIIERKVEKNGKVITRIYARSSYKDRQGKRHTLWRQGDTRTEAKERLKRALDELEKHGDEVVAKRKSTFAELAKFYEDRYLIPPVYKGDVKTKGLRSYKEVGYQLKPLRAYFGDMKLMDIAHRDIEKFKSERLATPVHAGVDEKGNEITRERALASVHRELSLLRRMLNIAVREKWIAENPFPSGDTLVSLADEVQRERILTFAEEERLFQAIDSDSRRAHLRPIIMCAIDTGMRRNEIFSLTWADVDLDKKELIATSFKGKKRIPRPVPMTERLARELSELYARSTQDPNAKVFGIKVDIKRSWKTIRRLAGLEDARLHDLRHCAATRMIRAGMRVEETGKILGHRQPQTTWRYININQETVKRAADGLDALRARETAQDESESVN